MKKIVIFTHEEWAKIQELLVEIESDIWDLDTSEDRSLMQTDLNKLEELLGVYEG